MQLMVNDSKALRGLNGTSLFKSLPDEVLIKISQEADIGSYQPEETIVWEGELSDSQFIIINGIVTVKKIIRDWHEVTRRKKLSWCLIFSIRMEQLS